MNLWLPKVLITACLFTRMMNGRNLKKSLSENLVFKAIDQPTLENAQEISRMFGELKEMNIVKGHTRFPNGRIKPALRIDIS